MVKNLTFGAPVLKSLRKHTDAFLDCHLMVTDPGEWVEVRFCAFMHPNSAVTTPDQVTPFACRDDGCRCLPVQQTCTRSTWKS